MLFRTVLVVAAIILSPVWARPTPVLDTDANASSRTIKEVQDMLEGLNTVMSMSDDCTTGQTTCVGQVLATCMDGKWKLASARRKRSKVDASCSHQRGSGPYDSGTRHSDSRNGHKSGDWGGNKGNKNEEQHDPTTVTTPHAYTVITTTTLTPDEAKIELSRLLSEAMYTQYRTASDYTAATATTSCSSSTEPVTYPTSSPCTTTSESASTSVSVDSETSPTSQVYATHSTSAPYSAATPTTSCSSSTESATSSSTSTSCTTSESISAPTKTAQEPYSTSKDSYPTSTPEATSSTSCESSSSTETPYTTHSKVEHTVSTAAATSSTSCDSTSSAESTSTTPCTTSYASSSSTQSAYSSSATISASSNSTTTSGNGAVKDIKLTTLPLITQANPPASPTSR